MKRWKSNVILDLDIYDLEDILEELKELEGKNRFQEGDIISKSSNKRVKRKSGKWEAAMSWALFVLHSD